MFRRTLRKLIPTHAVLPLCTTGVMMLCSYFLAKAIQAVIPLAYVDLTLSLDGKIPFQPIWVVAYFGSYIFWMYQYITTAKESPAMACRLAVADGVAKLICLVFFVVFPTTNVRPEITGHGVFDWLMRFLYWVDTPTNLFPSAHCMVAWLGTRFIFECKKPRRKALVNALCILGSILVFLSTLFTKQHVLLDVFAGIAVAEIGWLVARYTKLPQLFSKLNDRFLVKFSALLGI